MPKGVAGEYKMDSGFSLSSAFNLWSGCMHAGMCAMAIAGADSLTGGLFSLAAMPFTMIADHTPTALSNVMAMNL